MEKNRKIAVILFNLGGPDNLQSVKLFLFNLFNDKAIISLPQPFRYCLAKMISKSREKFAQDIYQKIGGKSPILEQTQNQAQHLEKLLNQNSDSQYKTFISMRYWHPFSREILKEVEKYQADEVVLLPLYPQYSTTTTQSSFDDWDRLNCQIPTKEITSYHLDEDFISAHLELLKPYLDDSQNSRILFSAHGLPQKIADKPQEIYPQQIEETVNAIVNKLDDDIDYSICYQSKVGKLKWLTPSLGDELKQAAKDQKDVVIVPISFVSEHSETLVELDIEYKEIAHKLGIKNYHRVPALGVNKLFMKSLFKIIYEIE